MVSPASQPVSAAGCSEVNVYVFFPPPGRDGAHPHTLYFKTLVEPGQRHSVRDVAALVPGVGVTHAEE